MAETTTATADTATIAAADADATADIAASDTVKPAACTVAADCGAPALCQTFLCDPALGCVAAALPDGAICTPADICAQGGTCSSGSCVAGKPKTCDDANPCTADQCNAATGGDGCSHSPTTAGCDDGNACTDGDACKDGQCQAGPTSVCACATSADCASKEDGDLCNGTLYCDASKVCKINPATVVTCAGSADVCAGNTCEPKTGKCASLPAADGTPCSDGKTCTVGDACAAGVCVGGTGVCCIDTAECAKADDGDLCNGTWFCNKASGACQFNPATVINCPTVDDTVCSKNLCEGKTGTCGAVAISTGKPCDDGNPCTVGDACQAGQCAASTNTCICANDTECAAKDDGDLCNGTLFCNKATGKCQLNPKTVVSCPSVGDSACKINVCSPLSGECAYKNINQFQGCDADGLVCTLTDTCIDGVCKPGANICECLQDSDCKDDNDLCNGTSYCDKSKPFHVCATKPGSVVVCAESGQPPCSTNKCQPATGTCKLQVGADGLDCDDGTACTLGDACKTGACVPIVAVNCDDDSPCTLDKCSPKSGCLHLPVAVTCSDDNACSTGDGCKSGACIGGSLLACADGNPCTNDGCDMAVGCVFLANAASCSDGDVCTLGDGCSGGKCMNLGKNPCSDSEPCTEDACDPNSGLCSHKASVACARTACLATADCAAGFICDVGLASCVTCTTASHCPGGHACQAGMCIKGTACESFVPCKPLGMVCDDTTGSCVQCLQDGDCGSGKVCQGQRCAPKVVCDTDADCPAVCDLQKKVCADCNKPGDCPGGTCGTDHMCRPGHTTAKQCAGSSLFTPMPGNQAYLPQQCGDDNPCTDGGCQLPSGCTLTVNSAPCDDGEVCSVGDTCKGGKCLAGSGNKCDDGKPCTTDKCDVLTSACSYQPYEGPCNDGNACTTGEICLGGVCKGGKGIACDDGNVCTDDSCDAKTGCGFVGNGAACDSGSCTTSDACKDGVCVSSKQAVVWESAVVGSKGSTVRGIAATTGGYFAAVSYGSASQPDGGALLRLDSQGKVIWKVEPALGSGATVAGVASSGADVMVCGSICGEGKCYTWVGKYSSDGKELASTPAGFFATGQSPFGTGRAIAALPGGGIVVAGRQGTGGGETTGFLATLDANLKLINGVHYVNSKLNTTLNAVAVAGGDFVVAGWLPTASNGSDGFVARVDASGTVKWQRSFGGAGKDEFNAVSVLGNGDIALAGSTGSKGEGGRDGWFVRLVGIGERADDRTFGTAGDDEFLAIADTGGRLALAGRTQGKGTATHGWLLALDGWGNTDWQRKWAGDHGADAFFAVTPHGSGLLVGGGKHDFTGQPNAALLRTDTFGHLTCATATGCIDKSALDCDDGKPCTLDGCEQGSCQSKPPAYTLPCDKGAGFCAGEVCKPAPVSCLALRDAVPDSASGVFKVDPDGAAGPTSPFTAWCDQTNDGGGWTLLLKADPATQSFTYESPQWLSASPLNADQPGFDLTEAKLASYSSLPLNELRVGLRTSGVVRSLSFDAVGPSLVALMKAKVKSFLGVQAWKNLVPSFAVNVAGYGFEEGLNPATYAAKARIGLGNDGTAGYGGTAIGLGCTTLYTPSYNFTPVGALHSADNKTVPAFGYVWAR